MSDSTATMYWGTPIIQIRNADHARIKPALVQHGYDGERRSGVTVASGVSPLAKGGLYESTFDLFQANVPEIQALAQFCGSSLHQALFQMDQQLRGGANRLDKVRIELFESWIHVTHDGGYHEGHTHPNCSWCGIYYVEIGDCTMEPPNGVNRFFPPFGSTYEDVGSEVCPLNPVQVAPEEGKLVLFPSYVRHSGVLYRGTRDRIVVAFNAKVQRA